MRVGAADKKAKVEEEKARHTTEEKARNEAETPVKTNNIAEIHPSNLYGRKDKRVF